MTLKQLWRLCVFVICCYITVVGGAKLVRQNQYLSTNLQLLTSGQTGLIDSGAIVNELNQLRIASGTAELISSDKLNQAAAARLAVLVSNDDVDGTKTGVTSENALKMVDYDYETATDMYMLDYPAWMNPVTEWISSESARTIFTKSDLTEVGIAFSERDGKGSVYIYLTKPAVKTPQTINKTKKVEWGGPELWQAVNKRRVELGVNPLSIRDELCTIASIRLNQLLDANTLDGHAGFVPTLNRDDLKWIGDKYNISEYLITGYQTPEASVKAWESTLGHRSLLAGGEFVWGCVYAQNSFGVAITAY